ncbi:MAG: hypothetical protein KC561_14160, partial [Myxococcales bacterium]|nr:hypothetical protein [Myxococcales bacterium]
MAEHSKIQQGLNRARRRLVARYSGRAAAALIGTSLAIGLSAALLLGLSYQEAFRLGALGVWLIALTWLIVSRFLAPVSQLSNDQRTAKLLERHTPGLRTDLSSALAFGAALERGEGSAEQLGSPALMRAHMERAARTLAQHEAEAQEAVPVPSSRPFLHTGLVFLLIYAAFAMFSPQRAKDGLVWLFTGRADEVTTQTVVDAEPSKDPLVSQIIVTYVPPAYTRRGQFRAPNPTGRIDVLAGTEVVIEATPLIQTERAALVVRPLDGGEDAEATEYDMQVQPGLLAVTFTPLQDSNYTFALWDGSEKLSDPIERRITVRADQVPTIELVTPDGIIETGPTDTIPFRFVASDDFGLQDVAFVYAFGAQQDHEQRIQLLTLDGELAFEETAGFELEPLALQPGDEISVQIEATDNDTIRGPKFGRSRPVLIRIASPEDRHLANIALEEE